MNWTLLEYFRERFQVRKDYWGNVYRVTGSGDRNQIMEFNPSSHVEHCPFETSERRYIPKGSFEIGLGNVDVNGDKIWRMYFQCVELGFFPIFRTSWKMRHGYRVIDYFVVCPSEADAVLLQAVMNK